MDYRRYQNNILVQMSPGEEILEQIALIAEKENIRFAEVTGLGSIREFSICVYDLDNKYFYNNDYNEPMELISLTGTITTQRGRPYAHMHMSVSDLAARCFGGHLTRAVVSVTCEMVIRIIEGTVDRKHHPDPGVNLFDFS